MGNKTSKKNAKLALDAKSQKVLLGKKVKYVSLFPGVQHTCPKCGRSKKTGMTSKYKEQLYCSEYCVQFAAKEDN